MAQVLSGVLYVEYFEPTANPGEYTFVNGVYNSQNDPLQEGAYGVTDQYVLFAPITDINTAMPVVGVLQRYKFTQVTAVDSTTLSGTILFDEEGAEVGVPGNGIFCLVSQVTQNKRIAIPPIDSLYTDLSSGSTVAAIMNDLVNILDKTSNGGTPSQSNTPVTLLVASTGQTVFTLPYDPVNVNNSMLIVNGVVYSYGADSDFIISGRDITWLNSTFVLDPNDSVTFR